MTWYYYSGKVPRPIQVKKGLSKIVRPRTKVEILELNQESKALIRKKELRVTGKDKTALPVADEPVIDVSVKKVVRKSELARKFAEKGVTSSPGMPPVAKYGPELTEAEQGIGAVKLDSGEKPLEDGAEEVDRDEKLPDDSKSGGNKKRRRRTD